MITVHTGNTTFRQTDGTKYKAQCSASHVKNVAKCYCMLAYNIITSRVQDVTDFAFALRGAVTSRDGRNVRLRMRRCSHRGGCRAAFIGFVAFSSELSRPARSGLYHDSAWRGYHHTGIARLNCINDVVVVVTDLDANSGVMHAPRTASGRPAIEQRWLDAPYHRHQYNQQQQQQHDVTFARVTPFRK